MKKTLMALLSLFLCCICLVSCAAGAGYERSAETLYELGLFKGTGTDSDGNPMFSLEREPTREEAVAMLVRLLGADEAALSQYSGTHFTDVSDWAKPYAAYAYENGLAKGIGGNNFGAIDKASASQYISFVLRALGYSSDSDFSWDLAWELSDAIGLTNGQYSGDSFFSRGSVTDISLSALYQDLSDGSETLIHKLCRTGAVSDEQKARNLLGDKAFTVNHNDKDSVLQIHFIDVGQADSALVICDGKAMLIDGGNVADSSLIYSYLKSHGITKLQYVVATHAHEDHVGGLSGALNYATAEKVLSPVTEYNSNAFKNFAANVAKQGKTIDIPKTGDSFRLGSALVTVLAPMKEYDEVNNSSIVLRLVHGKNSFLFMGDAQRESETDILDSNQVVKSDVLKVGHHGSETSTSYRLLYEVSPEYSIISCGKNNRYGHPHEAVMSRLYDSETKVFRTDLQGNIICTSDGESLLFKTERNFGIDTNPQKQPPTGDYIGNKSSMKFHLPSCNSLPAEHNRVYFSSRSEAVFAGYEPCKICKP
ncbi:MAG: MBL fold metallo-hydrolase [Clostridiales bacterium]|nr:MBL fold metallo-hydrolase [Clostridiales bacterium]